MSVSTVEAPVKARPGSTQREERLTELDGLRGLAAAVVFLCHFCLSFQPALLSGDPAQGAFAASTGISRTPLILFLNPELAVTVFFVLSGFVLAMASAKPRPGGELRRLAAQLLRRWIRLAGPLLGSSLLVWAAVEGDWLWNKQAAAANGSSWLDMHYGWFATLPNSLAILVQQSLLDVFIFKTPWWNLALWTMPIEFAGSVGLFAAYALLRRADRRLRVALLLCALAGLSATQYMGFAAGALLWEAHAARRGAPLVAWIGGAAFVLAALLGGVPFDAANSPYGPALVFASAHMAQPALAAHRIGAVLMAAATLTFPPLRQVLRSRLPQALGRVSFMVYLCHVVVLCSLTSWIVLRLTPVTGYDLATLAAFVATVAALGGLASGMTRLVDAPSIRLSRWAERRALAASFGQRPIVEAEAR